MKLSVLAAAACLVAASVAPAQWSEPVTVAESLAAFGAGPEFVPLNGDTVWVFWIHGPSDTKVMARCFCADTWRETQVLASGQHGVYWPAAAVDDSGRLQAAFYEGSYPTVTAAQDTWGIYTMVRTDTGWSRPELAHVMGSAFPYEIELGQDHDGRLGMVWDENAGGMSGLESVMFSRQTQSGWTPRCCIAPGSYPDVNCWGATLVPGRASAFTVAWCRSESGVAAVEVWDLDDSLTRPSVVLEGYQAVLAGSTGNRYVAYRRYDSLFARMDRGSGWAPEELVATKLGRNRPGLCTDNMGWAWACWPDSAHRALMVSYNSGGSWSRPETAATFTSLGNPAIGSDRDGRIQCVWFDHAPGTEGRLRHAVRLARPGVTEGGNADVRDAEGRPTFVRGVLFLSPSRSHSAPSSLLNAAGRTVTKLHAGANDLSHLSPGVYFLRSAAGSEWSAVTKVVMTR